MSKARELCDIKSPGGLDYFIDLFCVVRIGKRAPKFFEKRGHKMAVFANDYIGILINQFGGYEHNELKLLFRFLAPLKNNFSSGTALDIGANIGNHSLYFSDYFSQIYSFEPSPDTFHLLSFNTKWKKNISINNIGLGNSKGTYELVENTTNFGGAYISSSNEKQENSTQISVEKLDDLSLDFSNLTFIKIDVEGFEENVLKGGLNTLNKSQPLVVFEQTKKDFRNGSSPSLDLLKSLGYKFCWQQSEKSSKFWLIRRFFNLFNILGGFKRKIVTGEQVPKQFHSMLIAVPPRFFSTLKLD
ncbi:FkbM family methyltransferase [bacterium]|nr:FkbM family methyltransferase [bacterium]